MKAKKNTKNCVYLSDFPLNFAFFVVNYCLPLQTPSNHFLVELVITIRHMRRRRVACQHGFILRGLKPKRLDNTGLKLPAHQGMQRHKETQMLLEGIYEKDVT